MISANSIPEGTESAIIELRQYTLHPGRRDELIELFERAFVESQEAAGMRVLGTFRHVGHPDRFVWLRGFPNMVERAASLARFYDGPVWQAHRDAANATMIDSDNVMLLRCLNPWPGIIDFLRTRPPVGATQIAPGRVVLNVYHLAEAHAQSFAPFFEQHLFSSLAAVGATPVAWYETESAQNTFPRLPVREGKPMFVWAATFPDAAIQEKVSAELTSGAGWPPGLLQDLYHRLRRAPKVLVLEPTARSQWRPGEP